MFQVHQFEYRYSIDTEGGAANLGRILVHTKECFDGARISATGIGIWQGSEEPTVRVEILGDRSDRYLAGVLARRIAQANEQDSVLLTVTDSSGAFRVYSVSADSELVDSERGEL